MHAIDAEQQDMLAAEAFAFLAAASLISLVIVVRAGCRYCERNGRKKQHGYFENLLHVNLLDISLSIDVYDWMNDR